jgi:uncharacterized damage-inducible protein DinB
MAKIPYLDVLGSEDPLEVIRSTPARLAKVYSALSPEQAEARSAPGKWNLREVMAHLADCEVAWAWRLRYAYGAESPVLQPFDQDSWARPYSAYTLPDARSAFEGLRAWNVALVSALTDADKAKIYTHPERGEEPLWTLVQIMAGHDLHHLKTLEAL